MELAHVDDPLTVAAPDHEPRVQGGAHRGEVLRRIRLAQGAADRAAVADDRIGDDALSVDEDRQPFGEERRLEELAVPCHRTDVDLAAHLGDRTQLACQVVDVDEVLRCRQAQLHHRQQRVSACKKTGLGAELLQKFERMVDAGGPLVLEGAGTCTGSSLFGCRQLGRVTVIRSNRVKRWLRSNPAVTLAQLQSFVLVARLGSVKAAAAELEVTDPAVSVAVAALRKELGDELFVREGRGIALTPGGRRLAALAGEILGLAEQARRSVHDSPGRPRRIQVAATPVVAEHVGPLLNAFAARDEAVEIAVEAVDGETIGELLEQRRADIAVRPASRGGARRRSRRCRSCAAGWRSSRRRAIRWRPPLPYRPPSLPPSAG